MEIICYTKLHEIPYSVSYTKIVHSRHKLRPACEARAHSYHRKAAMPVRPVARLGCHRATNLPGRWQTPRQGYFSRCRCSRRVAMFPATVRALPGYVPAGSARCRECSGPRDFRAESQEACETPSSHRSIAPCAETLSQGCREQARSDTGFGLRVRNAGLL